MILGQSAELNARFTEADLARFHSLLGFQSPTKALPEPLIGALFSRLLGTELPGRGTNWLKLELTHHAPAEIGEPITARVEITRLRPETGLIDLACRATGEDGRLLASGRALVRLPDWQAPPLDAPRAPWQGKRHD